MTTPFYGRLAPTPSPDHTVSRCQMGSAKFPAIFTTHSPKKLQGNFCAPHSFDTLARLRVVLVAVGQIAHKKGNGPWQQSHHQTATTRRQSPAWKHSKSSRRTQFSPTTTEQHYGLNSETTALYKVVKPTRTTSQLRRATSAKYAPTRSSRASTSNSSPNGSAPIAYPSSHTASARREVAA